MISKRRYVYESTECMKAVYIARDITKEAMDFKKLKDKKMERIIFQEILRQKLKDVFVRPKIFRR